MASSRIAGITIEIGGDTSKLQNSLKAVDKQLSVTQSNLKDIDKLLKFNPGNVELLTQKQKNLTGAIESTEKRLKDLKAASEAAAKTKDNYTAWKAAFDPIQNEIDETNGKAKELKGKLKELEKAGKVDTDEYKNLKAELSETEKKAKDLKDRAKEVSDEFGNPISPEKWDDLQREIIATETDLKGLKDQYKDFGSVAAQQVAAAGQKMEDFGNKVTKAGQAFQPISTAATTALSGLAGLAMKAVSTADDLNTLSKQTGFTTEEIQKMKYAADLVDVSFEDIEGALKKLKPKITENNKALADLGVSTKNADGSTRNATDVFYDAIEALSKIPNETERDQKAMELFGKSADSLAGIIDDGGAALKAYGEEAEGMGLIMGQDTVDNLNKVNDTIDKLKAQGGGALAKLGATIATVLGPSIEKVMGLVSKATDAIAKLTPEQAETILKVLAVTAAIGPLLKTGGKLISGIGKVLKLAPKISSAIKAVNAVLAANPYVLIIAAVIALAVIIYKNWDKIKAWTKEMVDKVKGFFEDMKKKITDAVNKVKDTVSNVWNNIKTTVTNAANGVKTSAVNAWNGVKDATTKAFDAVKSTVTDKMNAVKKSFDDAGGGLKGIASATMTGIKEYYTLGFDVLNKLTGGKLDGIKTTFSNAFSTVKTTVSNAWDSIKTTASTKIDNIKSTVSTAFNNVVNKIKEIMKFDFKLPSLTLPTWDSMKAHFDSLVQSLKNAFKFTWSLPHIKLPHFKVTGGKWPYGLGGEGSLPSISIDWYKKAYRNPILFTSPTVMATPQGYKGFGDGTGAEIVMGLNKLQELVGASRPLVVNVYGAQGQSVDALADAVTRKIVSLQKQRTAAYA